MHAVRAMRSNRFINRVTHCQTLGSHNACNHTDWSLLYIVDLVKLVFSLFVPIGQPLMQCNVTRNFSPWKIRPCNVAFHQITSTTCSALFSSHLQFKGWPHHERTFSIYLCPLPFWLTLPGWVLSTSWCCPSRLCAVFLACVHCSLHYLLPGNSLVSS